jgi:hypothetical protein
MDMYQSGVPQQYRITRLEFLETGTYNDVYRRPYQPHLRPDNLGAFQEATQGGANITPSTVAGVAGDIMQPMADVTATDLIDITQGWGAKRFLFMMEIYYPSGSFNTGAGIRQLISGYTDYMGAEAGITTLTRQQIRIDPNLKMYVNSVVTLRAVEYNGPTGTYLQETIVDDSQILTGEYEVAQGGFGNLTAPMTTSLRPQDVFHWNQASGFRDAPTIDTRSSFAQGIKKSRRTNNLAADYLAGVANAYQQTVAGGTEIDNLGSIFQKAAGVVADPMLNKDRFFKLLGDNTMLNMRGFVTYSEVCRLQQGLDDMVDVRYRDAAREVRRPAVAGDSQHWRGNNMATVASTILLQGLPAIMNELLLTRVHFMCTNRVSQAMMMSDTVINGYDIRPIELVGFQQMPIDQQRWNLFVGKLLNRVLNNVTQYNTIDLAFTMICDLVGDSRVDISIQGGETTSFTVASFADARFTPVMANNYRVLETLANDISQLCQNITVDYGRGAATVGDAPSPGIVGTGFGGSGRNYMNEV